MEGGGCYCVREDDCVSKLIFIGRLWGMPDTNYISAVQQTTNKSSLDYSVYCNIACSWNFVSIKFDCQLPAAALAQAAGKDADHKTQHEPSLWLRKHDFMIFDFINFSYWCTIYAYRLRFARIISTLCTCHQWSEVSESKGLSSPPLPPPLPARPLKLLPPVPLPTAPRPSAGKKVNSARQRRSSRKACSCLPLPHLIIDPSN